MKKRNPNLVFWLSFTTLGIYKIYFLSVFSKEFNDYRLKEFNILFLILLDILTLGLFSRLYLLELISSEDFKELFDNENAISYSSVLISLTLKEIQTTINNKLEGKKEFIQQQDSELNIEEKLKMFQKENDELVKENIENETISEKEEKAESKIFEDYF